MKLLYCPLCGSYLEGGCGDMNDCYCGWKQPEDEPEDHSQDFREKTIALLDHILEVLPQSEIDKISDKLWKDVRDYEN